MTPLQAVELLDNAVARMALSRADHATLIEASNVIKVALKDRQEEKKH